MKFIKFTHTEDVVSEFEKAIKDFRGKGSFNFTYKLPTPVVKEDDMPVVFIKDKVYLKMLKYVMLYHNELAWHGTVERENNTFTITDVFLYPQTATSVTVTTDQAKYSEFINGLSGEVLNKMRFQGHSHVNMGVTPSTTDIDYYSEILSQIPEDDYYIFLIMNKKGEIFINIYDLTTNIQYETDDILFLLCDENFEPIETNINEEIKNNVSVYTAPAVKVFQTSKKSKTVKYNDGSFAHLYDDPKTYYDSDEFWNSLDEKYNKGAK